MPVPFGAPVPGGRTALHLAAAKGHAGIVQQLCAAGAELRAPDNDDNTAYLLACMNQRVAVADMLRRLATSDAAGPAGRPGGGPQPAGPTPLCQLGM